MAEGRTSLEFWRWFDLMPAAVRKAVNEAKTPEEIGYVWTRALREHGAEIRAKLDKSKEPCFKRDET